MNNKIKEARNKYKNKEITFYELNNIFFNNATDKQRYNFWSAPVYDRPFIIIGKSRKERDVAWNDLVGS